MQLTGLILDVAGIQKYIFSTNRLRQNSGASRIVQEVTSNKYLSALWEGDSKQFFQWEKEPNRIAILEENVRLDVVYTGGGHALLLFKKHDEAMEFARRWTLSVLNNFPGLQPMVGLHSGDLDPEQFQLFIRPCYRALEAFRAKYQVQSELPRYGVGAECIYTGSSAQYYGSLQYEEEHYYSESALIKETWSQKAQKQLQEDYADELHGMKFPTDFSELGGETDQERRSSIAVVHIDGNNLGKRFQDVKTLGAYRKLSLQVRDLMASALREVIKGISELIEKREDESSISHTVFPLRPILLAGDDVTYVCRGELGLWSAEQFLYALGDKRMVDTPLEPIHASAGVVITKPSYPFSGAYSLAEEACTSAKQLTRGSQDCSAIDFHILKGGVVMDLVTLRQRTYRIGSSILIGRPFTLGEDSAYYLLKNEVVKVVKDSQWPMNKLKGLREILFRGKEATEVYLTEVGRRNLIIPQLPWGTPKSIGNTPMLMDLCEFIEVYPDWLMVEKVRR